jgi:hypothetical protein
VANPTRDGAARRGTAYTPTRSPRSTTASCAARTPLERFNRDRPANRRGRHLPRRSVADPPHLNARVSGPLRYTMTASDAVELCGLVRPHRVIPIHYEGWKHFREGREAIDDEFEKATQKIRQSIRWLPLGVETEIVA